MSRPNVPLTLSNLKTLDDVVRYHSMAFDEFTRVFTGNISFTDNMFVSRVSVRFTAIDTDAVVMHTLQTIPTGYLVVGKSVAMNIYDGTNTVANPWTSTYLQLKSDTVGTATVLVFA